MGVAVEVADEDGDDVDAEALVEVDAAVTVAATTTASIMALTSILTIILPLLRLRCPRCRIGWLRRLADQAPRTVCAIQPRELRELVMNREAESDTATSSNRKRVGLQLV